MTDSLCAIDVMQTVDHNNFAGMITPEEAPAIVDRHKASALEIRCFSAKDFQMRKSDNRINRDLRTRLHDFSLLQVQFSWIE